MIDLDHYARARAGERAALIAALEVEAEALSETFRLVLNARMASHYLCTALARGDDASDADRDEYPFTEHAYREAIAALPFRITTEGERS